MSVSRTRRQLFRLMVANLGIKDTESTRRLPRAALSGHRALGALSTQIE